MPGKKEIRRGQFFYATVPLINTFEIGERDFFWKPPWTFLSGWTLLCRGERPSERQAMCNLQQITDSEACRNVSDGEGLWFPLFTLPPASQRCQEFKLIWLSSGSYSILLFYHRNFDPFHAVVFLDCFFLRTWTNGHPKSEKKKIFFPSCYSLPNFETWYLSPKTLESGAQVVEGGIHNSGGYFEPQTILTDPWDLIKYWNWIGL